MTQSNRLIKMQSYTRTAGVSISQRSRCETDARPDTQVTPLHREYDAGVAAAAPRRSGTAMLARAAPVAEETATRRLVWAILGYSSSDTMSGRLTVTSRSLTRPSESE